MTEHPPPPPLIDGADIMGVDHKGKEKRQVVQGEEGQKMKSRKRQGERKRK